MPVRKFTSYDPPVTLAPFIVKEQYLAALQLIGRLGERASLYDPLIADGLVLTTAGLAKSVLHRVAQPKDGFETEDFTCLECGDIIPANSSAVKLTTSRIAYQAAASRNDLTLCTPLKRIEKHVRAAVQSGEWTIEEKAAYCGMTVDQLRANLT